jgi:hypothetical protein
MGDNSRDYLWALDHSGKTADVVAHVRAFSLLPYPKWIRHPQNGMMQVEITPTKDDLADLETVRKALLVALADIETPFAGVCGRYVKNREGLGGHTLSVSVSAYERVG